ncbi:hypothetical protein [Desulfofalx alkaliphila]|uniref:hypothetical protein n=1 Tax=Desulfofalx alkaliphila TaxID=105483 RepID=UPI0004E1C68E|nr:hypothetical protein [Desulfofalx alkaliphila]
MTVGDVHPQTGKGKWHPFKNEMGQIDLLDTRGLGESKKPEEEITEDSPLDQIKKEVKEKCPDVILFLCKAKEVGSRTKEDALQLKEVCDLIYNEHEYDVPIIGVLTQVDELTPLSDSNPPFSNPKKQENINEALKELSKIIEEVIAKPIKVIPVCAYMELDGYNIAYDRRWNIDTLLNYLVVQLPHEAQLILAKVAKVKSVQRKTAKKIGVGIAGITGLIGKNPIPIADMPLITSLQLMMITTIAIIGGTKVSKESIIEFLSALGLSVGVGFALRQVARQVIKMFPVAGNFISGAIASAGTYALCEASIAYFIDKKSAEETKQIYKEQFEIRKRCVWQVENS